MKKFFKIMKLKIKIGYIKLAKKIGLYEAEEIFYIGGSEILPPPLEPEEEKYLISRVE